MKQISIVIPAYNAEHSIAKCLDSIINQKNLPSIEVIVVDDGSDDGTLPLLRAYQSKYDFIIVKAQENLKQSAARNNGLKSASGKYIMFFDSDDYLENGMISELYETIEREHTDLCLCGIKKIFRDRTEYETESCLKNSSDYLADYLTRHKEMDVGLWNKIFRREIIEKNNIFFENGNFFEDTLFVFKYLCNIRHNISFISKPLYNLFKREDSTTTQYSKDIEGCARRLTNKMYADLKEKNLERYQVYLDTLSTRNLIHIVHHNMKFNHDNKEEKIKSLLADIHLKSLKRLPKKYKLAVLLMKISPSLYENIYLSKKQT